MSTAKIAQVFVPDVTREVGPQTQTAIRQLFTVQNQHEQAFAAIKSQLDAKAAATATTTPTPAATTQSAATTATLALGRVNVQTGTSYMVQDSDYGGIIVLGNANPVAVTLNSACRQFWFGVIENLGPGAATLTPDQRSINYGSNVALAGGSHAWAFFDGMNWWAATVPAPVLPQTLAATPHEYLVSYNATTGTFTAAQPTFADITGQAALAQLPPQGISGTATLAAVTPTGSAGSIVFQNGVITAYTPPS